ncbi:hypothetical protein HDU87_000665 [Geranomyces variabilis]|uniref:CBM21 domain-containing protein n=1 Tax=Geranomyces variabilis TaxID=109894 RepID=A0AAD5THD7_9FUNG|nr:hypothetical protein HDU87_000665 [Geranomyces variabilis]
MARPTTLAASRLPCIAFLVLLLSCLSALAAPTRRDPVQVALLSYTYENGVLSGSIKVQNIAYQKEVTVVYATGAEESWSPAQTIAAVYASTAGSGFETWKFSASAPDATAFYIHYVVAGTSYYAPGNSNYKVTATSATTTATATATKTTTKAGSPTIAPLPPTISGNGDVIIQAFEWTSSTISPGTWWTTVNNQIPNLKGVFDMIWLPPATDSESDQGYLPRQWDILDSKYGVERDLRTLVKNLTDANILPLADIVINHRVGTHDWADFSNPAFPNNAAAVCSGDEWGQHGGNPQGAADTGLNYASGRDLDHTNADVQAAILRYLNTLKSIGYAGWRYDFVLGFGGQYVGEYNKATSAAFSVGEKWEDLNLNDPSSHRNSIRDWIVATGSQSSAFDFTTKGMLQNAITTANYASLVVNGAPCGLIGIDPAHAVTFVDNHDTGPSTNGNGQSGQNLWPFPATSIMLGYAYILTHPGVPSVYWYHYITKQLKSAIDPLIAARKAAGVTATSPVSIAQADNSVYAAYTTGASGSLAVKIGPGSWAPKEGYTLVNRDVNWAVWKA